MRVALYARVSSRAQAEKHTIQSQLKSLRELAAAREWRVVGEYIDDGRTAQAGHLEKRDGFARLARDAERGRFDVVAVFDLDRLTRSEEQGERGQILGLFHRTGVKVALATTGMILDLRTWEGDLYSSFQAVAAADWLRKHRERIRAGKLRAIAEGRKPAGPTPFGYSYDRATGIWSAHPDHGPIVREIFERVARGETCQAVADDLTDRGLQRPRGGAWSLERVWQIVTARTYLGEWVADRARGLKVPVPQLIDDGTWHAAQASLSRHRKRGLRRTKHVYLLEGLAICGLCGKNMGISSHGGGSTGYPRSATYVCAGRRRPTRGRPPCTLPHRKVAEVDRDVWDALRSHFERPDFIRDAAASRMTQAGADGAAWADDARKAKAHLARLQRVEASVLARYRRGLISDAVMDAELEATARERAMVQRQIDAAERAGLSAAEEGDRARQLEELVQKLRRRFGRATPTQRRDLVAVLLGGTKIVMTEDEVRATVRVTDNRADVGHERKAGYPLSDEANTSNLVSFPMVVRSRRAS